MTLAHTTTTDSLTAHIGLCLTDSEFARYGSRRFAVELADGLEYRRIEVSRARVDDNDWPGDSAEECASFAADGIDVIVYDDMDDNGRQHTTYRLVSERAVAAATVARIEE